MSDVSPDLITEISQRLLHQAQAAAAGAGPDLPGRLPSPGAALPEFPESAALPAALPATVPAAIPATVPPALAAGLPSLGAGSLPGVSQFAGPFAGLAALFQPPQAAPQAALPHWATPPGLPGLAPLALPDSPAATASGLGGFVQRVQSMNYRDSSGLCAEQSFPIPIPSGTPQRPAVGALAARPLDVPSIRRDFPILHQEVHGKPLVWFDNAATTQKPQSVIDALSQYYARDNSNIHRGAHTLAARATDAFELAREKVRQFLGAGSVDEIIFVRGATEGINLVAQTYGRKFLQPGDEIIVSTLEHHANIVPWQQIAREKGAVLRVIPVTDRGEIMLEEYQSLLSSRTRLVALTHASNGLGTLLPIADMIRMARRFNARVLIDGAQTVAHEPVNVQQLDCDFFVFSGHKIYGPTGIGAVFAKSELQEIMPPWQGGGNMIRNVTFEETTFSGPPAKFEAGTPNIADAVGLGAALDYVSRLGLTNISRYEHELLTYATAGLSEIKNLRLIGTASNKVGVISFVLPHRKTEEIGRLLDLEGIAVRAGHHCAQPSLRRFGVEATVRASFAFYNTKQEIDRLIAAVRRIQPG